MIDEIASLTSFARNDKCILLLNLGGPETLRDVKSFLFRLLDDPEIIRIKNPVLRKFIAGIISSWRAKSSQALYRKIGGGSPLRKLTEEQAGGLENSLLKAGLKAKVRAAFSCSDPLIEDVVEKLSEEGVTEFLLLPLFPQFSLTTTKGVLRRAREAITKFCPGAQVFEVLSFSDHPLFLKAYGEIIRAVIASERSERSNLIDKEIASSHQSFGTSQHYEDNWNGTSPSAPRNDIYLLFSAHSIPEKMVSKFGDSYRDEVQQSAGGVLKELNWRGPWSLSWQSKLGPVKWLGPSTIEEVRKLGRNGVKRLAVVPISFVADNLETLYDLDQLVRAEAEKFGITGFSRVPALNSHPAFIRFLTEITRSQKALWS